MMKSESSSSRSKAFSWILKVWCSESSRLHTAEYGMLPGRICEEHPNVNMASPQHMLHDTTAAKVIDRQTIASETSHQVIRFKKRRIGVRLWKVLKE